MSEGEEFWGNSSEEEGPKSSKRKAEGSDDEYTPVS